MTLAPGTRLGPYEVVTLIGTGGMGEVYRARDTQLKRDVALKVLPAAVASDADRLARFQREAELLAALNHPHIAQIYGRVEAAALPRFGQAAAPGMPPPVTRALAAELVEAGVAAGAGSGTTRALVMELVDGETLSARIARGSAGSEDPASIGRSPGASAPGIPLAEALPLAIQLAEALEYAHERGIIHRDLKPANIKLTADGAVKVLDFGLAKALDPVGPGVIPGSAEAANSPTITTPAMTRAGIILGTAAYMSPEQARGGAVDKRADIWAFGVVLFEMLAGRPCFDPSRASGSPRAASRGEGGTVADVLAAVLTTDPGWAALPSETPWRVRDLLRRCLEKDPKRRLRDIGDARLEIDHVVSQPDAGSRETHVAGPPSGRWVLPWILASVLAIVSAAIALWIWFTPGPRAPQTLRFDVVLPEGLSLVDSDPALAISRDGSTMVFAASKDGLTQLYQRHSNSFETTPIPKTVGARAPFFSPDGDWIGFFASGSLQKVSRRGGAPQPLWATAGGGGYWRTNGTILFNLKYGFSGLWSVPADGGTAKEITSPAAGTGTLFHGWPAGLPGDRAALLTFFNTTTSVSLGVLSLDARTIKPLGDGAFARYLPTGHLIFARTGEGDLMAAPFDPVKLEMTASPTPVLTGVMMGITGFAQFAVSDTGTLLYVPGGGVTVANQLVWVDRKGVVQPLPIEPGDLRSPRISPDGRRIAFTRHRAKVELWVYELGRAMLRRITDDLGDDWTPTWTRDGKRIVFQSTRSGARFNLFWTSADVGGPIERLTINEESNQQPKSWSLDGKLLAFQESEGRSGGFDILLLPIDGDRKPRAYMKTIHNEFHPEISPDGRWMAYVSDRSGRNEVYVQAFPGPGETRQVSDAGGIGPAWSREGRELCYEDLGGTRTSCVAIQTTRGLQVGDPTLVVTGSFVSSGKYYRQYDVAPDGEHFVMITRNPQQPSTGFRVIVNWFEELKAKVPIPK
jgi:serine/threonine protein kinase